MSNIRIHREHSLGLEKAREVAKKWQSDGEADLSLVCQYAQGSTEDVLSFKRSGIKGELKVTAHAFELNAKLGLLLAPFKDKLLAAANKNLDKLLG